MGVGCVKHIIWGVLYAAGVIHMDSRNYRIWYEVRIESDPVPVCYPTLLEAQAFIHGRTWANNLDYILNKCERIEKRSK